MLKTSSTRSRQASSGLVGAAESLWLGRMTITMKTESTAKLVRIFLGESDRWKGQPLYVAIVEEMRKSGLAGATVFKGILGFGAHSVVHAARIVDLSSDLPIVIELVESEEKVEAFLPTLD